MGIFDKLFGPSEVEKLTEKRDVEGLIKELEKADYMNAAEALRQIGDKRAVAPLIKALEYHFAKGEVCLNVVQALGELGDKRAVAPLITILQNPGTDAEVCYSIVHALAQIGGERAIEALIKALSDTRSKFSISPIALPSVADLARYALAQIGEPAVGPLTKALSDKDWLVRENAKAALAMIQEGQK